MPMQEPLNPEDLITEPMEVLEMDGYEFSEEELASIDQAVAEADAQIAAGIPFITAEEFFAQLTSKKRIAS